MATITPAPSAPTLPAGPVASPGAATGPVASAGAPTVLVASPGVATGPVASREAATVLVADDDEGIRELIEVKLRTAGYHVLSTDNGSTALDIAETHLPDLVILDVSMPGLTGFDVVYQLQELRATVRIPVIILSSLGGHDDVSLGYTIGADDYLIKPFSPHDLVHRVRSLLA
ncbi:hypothetical protein GCM10010435_22670 [Winogradskya consettensis]|uniref:Response regulatory domain-containing protein n=1 Tax=Winogradskya consettensis TaxID=113560 RepID=A0A919T525_9ACTN|nr:response regulator [Actinoplanes consettensis]GIM85248.1 hypothetical protein Aco04nite_95380 [Actinoplanes consettensis]